MRCFAPKCLEPNDIELWKFFLKQKLVDPKKCLLELTENRVEFVSLVWSDIAQCARENKEFLRAALLHRNAPLLQFLHSQNDFEFDNELLHRHLYILAEKGLTQIIQSIQGPPNQETLARSYKHAQDVQTLHALYSHFGAPKIPFTKDQEHILIEFHSSCPDHVQRFLFFVNNHFFTPQQWLDRVPEIWVEEKKDLIGCLYAEL